jgi:hypothetical protein
MEERLMNDKLKPAIIGGLVAGIPSGIPILGCGCCVFALVGGVLATHLFLKDAPPGGSPPYGEGAILGVLTGLIAALGSTIVGLPFRLLMGGGADVAEQIRSAMGDQEIPAGVEQILSMVGSGGGGCIATIIGFFVSAIVFVALCTIGSLIGVAIFGKMS